MQIGIIEKNPGDFAEIKRQHGRVFIAPTSSPAGWRATHRHGSFGRQSPDRIPLWTALLRLARQHPTPSEVCHPLRAIEGRSYGKATVFLHRRRSGGQLDPVRELGCPAAQGA